MLDYHDVITFSAVPRYGTSLTTIPCHGSHPGRLEWYEGTPERFTVNDACLAHVEWHYVPIAVATAPIPLLHDDWHLHHTHQSSGGVQWCSEQYAADPFHALWCGKRHHPVHSELLPTLHYPNDDQRLSELNWQRRMRTKIFLVLDTDATRRSEV